MSDNMTQLFEGIMRQPLGYLIVGILAPIAEELIFVVLYYESYSTPLSTKADG